MNQTPSANVALIQRLYAAFAQRDVPAIFGFFHPDIEIVQSRELPWGGTFNGHAGARTFFTNLIGAINSRVVFERFIDAGDNVVAIGRTQGTINATGATYDVAIAHVWTIRDGLATRAAFYIDNPVMRQALAQPGPGVRRDP